MWLYSGRASVVPILFFLSLATPAFAGATPATADPLVGRVTREQVVALAVERNPGVRASGDRADAMRLDARAEGRLPSPEVMAEAWQVPFENPLSFRDGQMLSLGLRQAFPAPGALAARAEARTHLATAEEASARDRVRELRREVSHAFADLQEAGARLRVHATHEELASRILKAAEARLGAGGKLADIAQAELEHARVDADVRVDEAKARGARARLNAFLVRPPDAPLGAPEEEEAAALLVGASPEQAMRTRPELAAAAAQTAAEQAMLAAARKEADWPMFTVGVSYFAPTTMMPFHGYGLSLAATLPWLWGGNGARRDAQALRTQAAKLDASAAAIKVRAEVAAATALADAASARAEVVRDKTLPAARRAFDVTLASYQSNQGDLVALLLSEQLMVQTALEQVTAEAELHHALADLESAVGAPLARPSKGAAPQPASGALQP